MPKKKKGVAQKAKTGLSQPLKPKTVPKKSKGVWSKLSEVWITIVALIVFVSAVVGIVVG